MDAKVSPLGGLLSVTSRMDSQNIDFDNGKDPSKAARRKWTQAGRSIMASLRFKDKAGHDVLADVPGVLKLANFEGVILKRAFAMYDLDDDGTISDWEFRRLVSAIGKKIKESQIDALVLKNDSPPVRAAAKAIKHMLYHSAHIDGLTGKEKTTSFTFVSFCHIMDFLKQITALGTLEEQDKKYRFIVEYDSSYRVLWDIFILLLLAYVLVVAPFRLGFDKPPQGNFYTFELAVDFCFMFDILIQFRTSYMEVNGRVQRKWYIIGKRYLAGYFTIDIFSSLPWDLMLPSGVNESASETRLLKTIRLVKLAKLGRISKLRSFLTNFKEFVAMNPEIFHVETAISLLVLLSHFLACLWGFAGRYGSSANLFWQESWQSRYGVISADQASGTKSEYLIALYWAVTTMTTVGFGDVTPKTNLEIFVTIVAMIVGATFYGYMTAVLTAWFLSTDPQVEAVNEHRKLLVSYLTKNKYPRELRRQIQVFFNFYYAHSNSFDEFKMLQQLPYGLHKKTADFLVKKMLLKYTIFSGIQPKILTVLLTILKPQSATIGEIFAVAGDPADTTYLIETGTVNVNNPFEPGVDLESATAVVGQFNNGQSFMEYGAFRICRKHCCSAVAITSCAMYCIRQDDITEIAGNYTSSSSKRDPFSRAAATIRQNIILLEQFRALSYCSQIGLDPGHCDFEDMALSLVLGSWMEDLLDQKVQGVDDAKARRRSVNDLEQVVEHARRTRRNAAKWREKARRNRSHKPADNLDWHRRGDTVEPEAFEQRTPPKTPHKTPRRNSHSTESHTPGPRSAADVVTASYSSHELKNFMNTMKRQMANLTASVSRIEDHLANRK